MYQTLYKGKSFFDLKQLGLLIKIVQMLFTKLGLVSLIMLWMTDKKKKKKNVVDGLKLVRDDSILFNKIAFGNVFRRKRFLEARFAGIQK